jgi:hypothetical protein
MLSEAERNNQLQIVCPNGAIFFIVGINGMPLYKTSAFKVSQFWQHKPQTDMTAIQDITSEHRDSILYDIALNCTQTASRVTAGS